MSSPNSEQSQPSDSPDEHWRKRELLHEIAYVSRLYERLDTQRGYTADQLDQVHRQGGGGTLQARLERTTMETQHTRRLAQLNAAEHGLCFGRLDLADGENRYVGRISLTDDKYEPLLIDWRAPAAEAFYRATPADPGAVVRRRHLKTFRRQVVDFTDDAFGIAGDAGAHSGRLSGEAALLASLNAARTGRMGDIVTTIQAEQDRIIRADLRGVLVVQGGPGTGKTVVALHRAAYLMYTHRERLSRSGVLIVGPNPTFMRYIDQVLPALGEGDVVLRSVGELYPGVTRTVTEPVAALTVKGDARMATVLAAAVRDCVRLPSKDLTVTVGRGTLYQEELRLSRALCARAADAARLEAGEPHNTARAVFVAEIADELAHRIARRLGLATDGEDVAELRAQLLAESELRTAVQAIWPALSPESLLSTLFSSPELLERVGSVLTEAERLALLRPPAHAPEAPYWTEADVPLLDETAELLGPLPDGESARAAALADAEEQAELAFARLVLDDHGGGIVQAEQLVRQYRGERQIRSVADRAAADRSWAFGHVIVDEAQELSPMAWRMLLRRCPSRSMTVVGDLAQASNPAAPPSWEHVLDGPAGGRWRAVELSVNYRTPAEIMSVAAGVLHAVDPSLPTPTAVRSTDAVPWSRKVPAAELADRLRAIVAEETAAVGDGRLAVIVADPMLEPVCRALDGQDGTARPADPDALDSPAVVLTPAQSKGLEFDTVLIVEPEAVIAANPRGLSDLYVALTRATRGVGFIHTRGMPAVLAGVSPLD
ncbi:HelD family protein [Streptomyces sp. NPDC002559]